MDVDDRDIGRIVGRGGCNIRDLQELSPVKKKINIYVYIYIYVFLTKCEFRKWILVAINSSLSLWAKNKILRRKAPSARS